MKSTEAQSGGPALTARRTGRWLRRALRYPQLSAVRRPHLAHGTGRSDRHCILLFEARRYRYFNVWRARARLLETDFYAPMIRGEGIQLGAGWAELLAKDYCDPRYHIGFVRAVARRLRRTYAWIFVIQAVAYYGKLAIHPTPPLVRSQVA